MSAGAGHARSLLGGLVEGHLPDEATQLALNGLSRASRPMSLPGLCNLLWFDRGVDGGHEGAAFDAYWDSTAPLAHDRPVPAGTPTTPLRAVPLGAIVSVRVGEDTNLAEVVWKEGAHPALDDSWVPAWLSGAPMALPDDGPAPDAVYQPPPGERVTRERMVADFGCLGELFLPKPAALARLARRHQADPYGHFIARVAYHDGQEALDDVAFWAAWTAARHRRALEEAGIAAEPAALADAAAALGAVLAASGQTLAFGPYVISERLYRQVIDADTAEGGPIGRAVRSLAHIPAHQPAAWASMSARLAAESGSLDENGCGPMAGTGWPTMVVCASLRALETLAVEAADGDWNGVHVRLDDAWQGGGLWCAQHLDSRPAPSEDPSVALGLGWASHTGIPAAVDAAGTDSDGGEDDELVAAITGSEVTWTLHLSSADIDADRLKVPANVAEVVAATLEAAGQEQLVVRFTHDGHPTEAHWCRPDPSGHLRGVIWPLGAWPGTTVRVAWSIRATVVVAATRALAVPETFAGLDYTHEFNEAVALAAAGLGARPGRAVPIAAMVRAAVIRNGELTETGEHCCPLDDVVAYCFGPFGEVAPGYSPEVLRRAVIAAVGTLSASGSGRCEGDLVVVAPRRSGAGRAADMELMRRFAQAAGTRLRRVRDRHAVTATVVNLTGGRHRSAAKDASFTDVAGTGRLPDRLAAGQTWRRAHTRGQQLNAQIEAELERTRRAVDRRGGAEVTAELDTAAGLIPAATQPAPASEPNRGATE